MNTEEPTLFDPDYRNGRHRNPDWTTSIQAAHNVAYRAGSQRALLLQAFKNAYPNPLTDEQAATHAGINLNSEYSKRCGELRQDGHITVNRYLNGEPITQPGNSGIPRITSTWNPNPTPQKPPRPRKQPTPCPNCGHTP